ncbi:hypothetical protein [Notoacmeibacter ruber]|uniref:Uncharacterized protein n=1 Tax=Notoacmeibacter ruber TaxID=2670375 RepID=A0A3L7JBI8_9HYPH|nr:hypothetical protein [Notoacmeibacter ruber]RLQ88118.1 hypothetical protein D8780_07790 [Notoacmeibacter ruber]
MFKVAEPLRTLFLVPAVMTLRTPLLLAEAGRPLDERPESTTAFSEKIIAAQVGMWAGTMAYVIRAAWLPYDLMAGRSVESTLEAAQKQAARQAMAPANRQVRKNYRRLTR